MAKYRDNLPQLGDKPFLTDAGMETYLVFHKEIDLPEFAAFPLLATHWGQEAIIEYTRKFVETAVQKKVGFILEAPTWRANPDWVEKLNYSHGEGDALNRKGVALMAKLRDQFDTLTSPMVISGCIGPRGDGYRVDQAMTVEQAKAYHSVQIKTFADTEADMVTTFTLNYVEEAVGVVKAAQEVGIPVVIGFTLETDGKLPSGQELSAAIEQVDAETDTYAAYFMINCAHPTHFESVLAGDHDWKRRIKAVRGNASICSHAELDEAEELDEGNPEQLAKDYQRLQKVLPDLSIYGGCCGTDHRHVSKIAEACL